MFTSPETDPNLRRNAHAAPGAGPDPLEAATGKLRSEWEQAFSALKRSFYVERQALGLKLFDFAFRLALIVCAGFTLIALSVAGALLVVIGARSGLAAWTGGAWWADLVLGAAILGLLAWGAHLARRAVHRRTLARTRSHLGLAEKPEPSTPAHLVPPTARSAS